MPQATLTDKDFYKFADIIIKALNAKAIKRFKSLQRKISTIGIDELNVLRATKETYEALETDNIKAFIALSKQVYYDIFKYSKNRRLKRKGSEDGYWEYWLLENVLNKVDPVTQYIYTNEVKRKQERTAEALVAAVIAATPSLTTTARKRQRAESRRTEIGKALRYWSLQTTQYSDIITDAVSLKAYKDMGVEYVQWNTQEDERVCKECEPLDKKVFKISEAPKKLHWRCRCYLTPYQKPKSKG